MPANGRLAPAAAVLLILASSSLGCDKLKGALGKGDDAGSSSSKGGGLLSFLGTDFEGEISANITSKKPGAAPPSQVVFGIKKPKYRVDMSGGAAPTNTPGGAQGALLLDPPAKKGWILNPAQKMAIAVDFEKMKSMPKMNLPGMPNAPRGMPTNAPSTPPKIEKTNAKDTVAGYTCEIWNITSEGKRAEACVAEGITWVDLTDLGWSSPELTVAAVASEANRFPLRVISFDAKGVEEMRMEATKVDKKKLDDTKFVVPADYRVVDMAAMMGGLGGAFPGGNIPTKPR
jgi:hypothetical protein